MNTNLRMKPTKPNGLGNVGIWHTLKLQKKNNNTNVNVLPNPPPLSEDGHFNKAVDAIRAFKLSQMALTFQFCYVCKERRMSMKMADQTTCRRCSRDKNAVNMFSNENNMNPGPVPDELKDLSIEQQLICRIAPAIHVHMVKHGG